MVAKCANPPCPRPFPLVSACLKPYKGSPRVTVVTADRCRPAANLDRGQAGPIEEGIPWQPSRNLGSLSHGNRSL
jgi:hypothetical protein